MTVFKFFIFILALVLIYKLCFYISKRLSLIFRLLSLKKLCGATVRFTRFPLLSLIAPSKKPDAVVEIGNTVYLIRLINGRSGLHFLHFASPEYFVTFLKSRFFLGGRVRVRGRFFVTEHKGYITTSGHSVKILPPLEECEKYANQSGFYEKKTVPVLIVNPTPCEVSYVTASKSSIKVAFTGDEIYGVKLFTPKTFVIHADREKREEDRKRKEGIFS